MATIRPAQRHETLEALQRVFQYLPQDDALTRIRNLFELFDSGGQESPQLLVAGDGGRLAGAILLQALVGSTGVVWTPQIASSCPQRIEVAESLAREAVRRLRECGAKVIQSVLTEAEEDFARPLRLVGFRLLTQLLYFRHDLELPPELLCAAEQLSFQTYAECDQDVFQSVLMQTYEATRDFPELNGRRSAGEVLAGLQASGYDPSRWWLALDSGGAIGVLAVNEVEAGAWDVAYVGVTPTARRKRYGRELMRKALFETKAGGAHELILSVDARNEPALRLYRSLGFENYDQRSVYLLME